MAEFCTKAYSEKESAGSIRFTFYCDACGQGYSVAIRRDLFAPDAKADDERAFQKARERARARFNCCTACGAWVCDADYNRDEGKCANCAPVQYIENEQEGDYLP